MRKVFIFSFLSFLLLAMGNTAYGQTIFSTNFNSTLPTGWTIDASAGATWVHSGSLGVGSSGCAMVDQSSSSGGTKGRLITTSFNLTTVSKPTLSFKVASIRNNFVSPNLYIHYSVAGGTWQKLSSWGEWNTDNIINTTGPCFPQNNGCVEWQDVVFDLAKVAGNTNIRFAFEADCLNGGWLLLDDLWIHDKKIYPLPYLQDFEGAAFFPQDWGRTGTNTQADWQRSLSVGAFNSTSSAFFDNYSLNNKGEAYGMSTVWLNLSTAAKPTLSFEYAYAKRTGQQSDELRLLYQLPGGAWVPIDSFKDKQLETTFERTSAFVPNNREWLSRHIDLSALSTHSEVRFAIECKSQYGNILYVDNVRFYNDTASTTSVNAIVEGSDYSIYPNPAQDVVYINTGKTKPNSIYVYNSIGQQMKVLSYAQTNGVVILHTSALSNGVYTIHLSSGNAVSTKKLIINR